MNLIALRSSLRPTLAVTRLWPAAMTAGLGCIPLVLATEPREVPRILVATSVITAFGVGFALDDSAAVTLESSPTTARVRVAIRLALLAIVLVAGTALQVTIAVEEAAGVSLAIQPWLVEHAVFVALTLVVTLVAQRTLPDRRGGAAAAPTGLLVVIVIALQTLLTTPVIDLYPGTPLSERWWYVLGAAVIALGWLTRDRAARRWGRRPRPHRHDNAPTRSVHA